MNQQSDDEYIKYLETELNRASSIPQSNYPASATMFGGQQKQNLVEWQLDFRPELADIEHLLRCDVIKRDPKTQKEFWDKNPDESSIVMNETGVNDLLREIRMFLNKNKVLSNYDKIEIKERVRMFGHELRALIYNNLERYGIDNEYKQNNYPIIVITILDMVEASYRRAINGEERRDLNSARVVNQTDPIMNGYPMQGYPQITNKKTGIAKILPWNWGK